MTDTEAVDGEVLVHPSKFLRLADMIDRLVFELHAAPIDDAARERLLAMYRSTLVEVGSTLSDALLDELGRLQTAGLDAKASIDEARVAMTQLEGWLHGVIEGMISGALSFSLPLEKGEDDDEGAGGSGDPA